MFERTLLGPAAYERKPFAFVVSTFGQVGLILLMILVPLLSTDTIPSVFVQSMLQAPTVPPPASPAPPKNTVARTARQAQALEPREFVQPRTIPTEVAVVVEEPPPAPAFVRGGGVIGITPGMSGGQATAAVLDVVRSRPLPAPPPEAKPDLKPVRKALVRVRAGGQVRPPALLTRVPPVYPPIPRQARIQGVVKLNAIIGIDGRVTELKVVSGHPLLAPAALQAVRQWVYRPTLLNGEPVEVVLAVDVSFRLGR